MTGGYLHYFLNKEKVLHLLEQCGKILYYTFVIGSFYGQGTNIE